MLFKLSTKNIRKSVKDYAIYFVTLVLGISVFYIFNAIETQASFLQLSNNAADALQLMMSIITGMSVFIAFVLGFLVVYASRFLMKRRNREFALYMTLGMRKGSVAGILSLESLLVGLLSLAAGLALGIVLSQLMSTFVAQLFEADLTQFVFTFSMDAFLKTILYFGIIMLVVLIFDLIMVGKARLISLMQSGVRTEKVKVKNPVLCIILFIIGAGCLAFSYWYVTADIFRLAEFSQILIPIFVAIIGTFLVFWSVSGILLNVLSHFRKVYYKGLNSFTFRQFSGRINTMVVSVTVICVMLFFSITVLSAAFSLRSSLNRSFRELTPVDVEIAKVMSQDEWEDVFVSDVPEEEAKRRISLNMEEVLSENGYDPAKEFSDYVLVSLYATPDFTMADAFGNWEEEIRREYPNLLFSSSQMLMTESDYNRVAKLFGHEVIDLGEDEYVIICNTDISKPEWDKVLSGGGTVNIFGHELKPKYPETQDGFVRLSSVHEETGLFIIPDEIVDEAYIENSILLGNYKAADDAGRAEAEEHFRAVVNKLNEESAGGYIRENTKIDIQSASVSLGAVATFVGLYLGFVFLISGAAILALKALSDSIDSRGRYHMLRQIGADEKEITGSLRKQQALLFLLPMALAVIHSIFGMRFTDMVLSAIGIGNTAGSMILTAVILIVIYAGYFLVTFLSSKRIIREKD